MNTHRIPTAVPVIVFVAATFALAAASATTGGRSGSCYPDAATAAKAIQNSYGLGTPDAIERWNASAKNTEPVVHTRRSADSVERWQQPASC